VSDFKVQKLVGQYFHTYKYNQKINELEIENQGCIEGKVTEEYYICQIFSFMDGSEIHSKLVHIQDMKSWRLYKTNILMNSKYVRPSYSKEAA
jgi:hypothetical protein